ncbi:OmpA family protein [Ottowia sp. VDI28]|uniref:OmpA family protein n=1 Tax=Ottowia sp. VDI28 TaxID=3133968 RepID=UPI003C2DA37B
MASSQDDDNNQRLALGIVFSVIVLAVGLAIGVAMHQVSKRAAKLGGANAAVSTVDASAAGAAGAAGATGAASGGVALPATPGSGAMGMGTGAASTGAMTSDAASVVVESGVVKFYFASGKAELAQGAKEALGDIVKGVAAGQTASISGFHDDTGNAAQNEELAKLRAVAVRDTLISLGIGEDKLELRKPEVTTATGSNAEARRVEVRLQ